ncbi:Putative aspartic-type endopeptidase opsB [Verticillium dahliae VDG1]|nr:Putative aspartic-type endopeptidase opsB [Verticillium dahliae VDG1]
MSAYESFVECCQDLTWGTFVVTLSDVLISVLEEMGENQPVDVDDDDDDLYTLDRQRLPHVPMNLPKGWHTIVSRTIELVTTFMEGRDDSSQADDRVSGYPESTPDTSTEATMALLHQIATTQTAILTRMDGISADVSQLRSEAIQRDTSLTDMHRDPVPNLSDIHYGTTTADIVANGTVVLCGGLGHTDKGPASTTDQTTLQTTITDRSDMSPIPDNGDGTTVCHVFRQGKGVVTSTEFISTPHTSRNEQRKTGKRKDVCVNWESNPGLPDGNGEFYH